MFELFMLLKLNIYQKACLEADGQQLVSFNFLEVLPLLNVSIKRYLVLTVIRNYHQVDMSYINLIRLYGQYKLDNLKIVGRGKQKTYFHVKT